MTLRHGRSEWLPGIKRLRPMSRRKTTCEK